MDFTLLLTSMALIFPGAAGYRAFFYAANYPHVERLAQLGVGTFLSMLGYSILAVAGCIDLQSIVNETGDGIDAEELLRTGNLVLFLLLSSLYIGIGGILGRLVLWERGRSMVQRVLGRSLEGTPLTLIAKDISGKGVTVYHDTGVAFHGVAATVSMQPDGMIVLHLPKTVGASGTWVDMPETHLALRLAACRMIGYFGADQRVRAEPERSDVRSEEPTAASNQPATDDHDSGASGHGRSQGDHRVVAGDPGTDVEVPTADRVVASALGERGDEREPQVADPPP